MGYGICTKAYPTICFRSSLRIAHLAEPPQRMQELREPSERFNISFAIWAPSRDCSAPLFLQRPGFLELLRTSKAFGRLYNRILDLPCTRLHYLHKHLHLLFGHALTCVYTTWRPELTSWLTTECHATALWILYTAPRHGYMEDGWSTVHLFLQGNFRAYTMLLSSPHQRFDP